jgi:hypothetical protein
MAEKWAVAKVVLFNWCFFLSLLFYLFVQICILVGLIYKAKENKA